LGAIADDTALPASSLSLLAVAAGADAELIIGLKKAESEIFVLL
jgi:hypothetical protein